MKEHSFFKAILLVLSLFGILSIRAQITYDLYEGFESGIPQTWSQEHIVGSTDWVIESNGTYPNTSAEGSKHVILRNNTQQTQGFVTRLISPPINLSRTYQPVLVFSHAQDHNLGDVDELRIYYRISDKTPWVLMEEYIDRIRDWRQDTIRLINPTATYQIAFEGTDKYGRGIVLDDIQVRSMPMCSKPVISGVTNTTSNSFTLHWLGDYGVDGFAIKVSRTILSNIEEATDLVLDTTIVELDVFSCSIQNLDVNTTYYCYVKAHCGEEESAWSDYYSYRTKSMCTPPYSQKFNKPYNVGYFDREDTWTWNNSWMKSGSNTKSPHINTNTAESELKNYSRDETTCVVFSDGSSTTTPVKAGEWTYVSSPEVLVDDMSTVQVSFWGTAYAYVGDTYASSLIVGVMSDPQDINSFIAVDTVTITSEKTFEEFIILFDKYTGTGKYVTFLSRFDKKNLFYLDDVTIEIIPECPKIRSVKVSNTTSNSALVSCQMYSGASAWDLIITNEEIKDAVDIDEDKIVFSQNGITTSSFTATELPPFTHLYAYVRNVCGENASGTWSNGVHFRTACEKSLPMFFGFEKEEGIINIQEINPKWDSKFIPECLITGTTSSKSLPPHIWTSATGYSHTGEYALYLNSSSTEIGYVAFPPINNIQDVQISFWMNSYSSSNSSKMVVGVMSDSYDITTFDSVAVFEANENSENFYEKQLVLFKNYQGAGKYIAFKGVKNETMIDDVQIELIPECIQASNLKVEPQDKSALITWDANGEKQFRLLVDTLDMSNSLNVIEYKPLIDTTITGNSLLIEELATLTNYYYTIQTLCSQNDSSAWWPVASFKTKCPLQNSLPYFESFEQYEGGEYIKEIPECWETVFMSDYYSYYPHIANSSVNAYSGSKSLLLSASPFSSRRGDYVALPRMDAGSMRELQVSFMMKTLRASETLEVGIISDLADTTTFVPIKTFTSLKDNEPWKEIVITFQDYEGEGEHIMFRVPVKDNYYYYTYIYVDNIEVDFFKNCYKPQNMSARDITDHSALLYWDNGLNENETKWELMVLKTDTVLPQKAHDDIIVFKEIINSNPFLLNTNLTPETQYYYYLRSICGVDTTNWTVNYGSFKTGCVPKTIEAMGVETFEDGETNFDCWEKGVLTGTTATPSITANSGSKRLYIYNTTSSDGTYAIMPKIDIDSITRLRMTFDMYSTYTHPSNVKSIIVGVITDPNDFASFVSIDTLEINELNKYDEKFTVRFDKYIGDYNGEYGKRVVFLSSFGLGSTINYVYIDNIRFDTLSSCLEPTMVWADFVGTYGALLKWDGEQGNDYRLIVSKKALSEIELGTITDYENEEYIIHNETIPNLEFEFSNLDMLTTYYAYVQKLCSDKKSQWSKEYSFTTKCPIDYPIPYIENFDSYDHGEIPSCWTTHYGEVGSTDKSYPYCNISYNNTHNGKASLHMSTSYFPGEYCMAISPRINIDDISKCMLYLDVAQGTAIKEYSQIIVGVTDDPNNLTLGSFLPIDTICITKDQENAVQYKWYKYKYDLSYLDTNKNVVNYKHLVFVMDAKINSEDYRSNMFLDNIELELTPTCLKPEAVSFSDNSETSFVVSWKDTGTAAVWNVQYGVQGFELGAGTTLVANSTTLQISGLNLNTTYDVYLQADCQDGDTSVWIGPYSTTTLLQAMSTYPYIHGFEDDAENLNYHMELGEAVNRWYVGDAIAKDGQKSLYISRDNGQTAIYNTNSPGAVWASRIFKMPVGIYSVSFDWTCYGEGHYDFMRAGFLPAGSSVISSSASSQGQVVGTDGTVTMMYADASGTPPSWLSLEGTGIYRLNQVDAPIEGKINWKKQEVDIVITEDMPKYYNLVFYWRNDDGGGNYPKPSAVIDNIEIKRYSCPVPWNIVFDEITDTSAKLSWEKLDENQENWSVKVLKQQVSLDDISAIDNELVVYSNIVNTNSCEIPNLDALTVYYVYISANCSDEEGSWAEVLLKTSCPTSFEAPIEFTFNDPGGYPIGENPSYIAPDCWIVGLKKNTSAAIQNFIPYKYPDKDTETYSRADGGVLGHSLRFFTTSTDNGAYAIMPEVVSDVGNLQLHFHARAASHTNTMVVNRGYKISTTYTREPYARSIIVGTVTNQDDISTFVPIDTVELTTRNTSEYANEENNWLFDEVIISLIGANGKHVAFLSEFEKDNCIFLDDIRIENQEGCYEPRALKIESVTSTTASLAWKLNGGRGSKWVIRIAKDEAMTNIVSEETVSEHVPFLIDQLSPATKYYVAVKQLCEDNEETDWSEVLVFRTLHALAFNEVFNAEANTPDAWSQYSYEFTDDIVYTRDMSVNENTSGMSFYGWIRTTSGYGLPSAHQILTTHSADSRHWLVSPVIELPEAEIRLTFDLALTAHDSSLPLEGVTSSGVDERFIVAISDDGGISWKASNTTEWNNQGTGDYVYSDISSSGENIYIDLSKYAGKAIKVGFYGESTVFNAITDIHIDNIHINEVVKIDVDDIICSGHDYRDHGFDIMYDELKIGENNFSRSHISNAISIADTIVSLKLTVTTLEEKLLNASICEGGLYAENDFIAERAGTYKRKMTSTTGCDSIVVLNLTTIPAVRVIVQEEICKGKSYDFNGKKYDRTGVYLDTLKSVLTGCDSIVTLQLKVNDVSRSEFRKTICYGEIYSFGGKNLDISGTYKDTLQTAIGCDSIVTLILIVRPELRTIIEAVTCPDEPYTGHGFFDIPSIAKDYERTEKTSIGNCDSTIILRLTVLDGDTVWAEKTIYESELPYTFHGKEYGKGTPVGTYVDTTYVTSGSGNCKSVVITTLIILEGDRNNLWSTRADELLIIPTLIERGESVQISGLTTLTGLTIEVYDMTGRSIHVIQQPTIEPIEINAFHATGIYVIKAISSQGDIKYGRVIVK